jgi:hypothetical protein
MVTKHDHMSEPLPNRDQLFWVALGRAMTRKGGYTGYDLKDHLAGHFKLTNEQLAQSRTDGTNRFGNLVDWVTAEFTTKEIHTGWNGEKHKSPDDLYFLTPYGYIVGERRVKPKGNQHGPRNARPDIRQLSEEQERIAPWLKQDGNEPSDLDKILSVLAAKQHKF